MAAQLLATGIILIISGQLIIKIIKDKALFGRITFWLIFWTGVLVLIWSPGLTTKIADLIGIGRGVDILIYFSIILLFYSIFHQNSKIDEINKDITKIVREIAKNEASRK